MARAWATLLGLILCTVSSASAQFFQPLTKREVWRIGEVHTIHYNTKLTNYTIALWQQAMAGGSATIGPILVRTENGPEKEFEWKVQLYDFDLDASNIFFFWLTEGASSNQGTGKTKSMSSAYFNITDKPLSSSASTTPGATLTTLSTSPSASAPSADAASMTTTEQEQQTGTAPDQTQTSTSGSSSGLPVAAQAGIGVGVSIIGLTCIFCAVLWFRYIKKQQQVLADLQQRAGVVQPTGPTDQWKMPPIAQVRAKCYYTAEMDTARYITEMPTHYGQGGRPAELGT
ncbi:hypothetical protein VTI74DRAFT_8370 [Chaetomium olivicolor]